MVMGQMMLRESSRLPAMATSLVAVDVAWEWTADDSERSGWLEKGELFDKTGVTNVDQAGEQRACFGHCGGEPSSLVWIGGVGMGKAVKIGFRCSTDGNRKLLGEIVVAAVDIIDEGNSGVTRQL